MSKCDKWGKRNKFSKRKLNLSVKRVPFCLNLTWNIWEFYQTNEQLPGGIRGQGLQWVHSLGESHQDGGQAQFQHLLYWVDILLMMYFFIIFLWFCQTKKSSGCWDVKALWRFPSSTLYTWEWGSVMISEKSVGNLDTIPFLSSNHHVNRFNSLPAQKSSNPLGPWEHHTIILLSIKTQLSCPVFPALQSMSSQCNHSPRAMHRKQVIWWRFLTLVENISCFRKDKNGQKFEGWFWNIIADCMQCAWKLENTWIDICSGMLNFLCFLNMDAG